VASSYPYPVRPLQLHHPANALRYQLRRLCLLLLELIRAQSQKLRLCSPFFCMLSIPVTVKVLPIFFFRTSPSLRSRASTHRPCTATLWSSIEISRGIGRKDRPSPPQDIDRLIPSSLDRVSFHLKYNHVPFPLKRLSSENLSENPPVGSQIAGIHFCPRRYCLNKGRSIRSEHCGTCRETSAVAFRKLYWRGHLRVGSI
jgi:hypothetical protein